MIPDVVSIVFLAVPLLCLVYILHGGKENPIWGNILFAGLGAVCAGMVAMWFLSGVIVSTSIVSNATYEIPSNLTMDEMIAQQSNISTTTNSLGSGGSGMFVRSAISASTGENLTNQTTVSVHTYDIIYQQYQDIGIMFFYMMLCLVLVALFLWSVADMRQVLNEQDSYDEYLDGE